MADAVAMNYHHNEVIFTVYAKAALEAMRVLVKNDPKGCQTDDEMLQKYIDTALK